VRVEILIYDRFDELDAIGPFEVLTTASQLGAPFETALVSLCPPAEIVAAHGLHLRVDHGLAARGKPDIMVVPGGGWNNRSARGARAECERGEIPRAIAKLHASGCTVAAVCTGAMLVAAAGIVKNRPAITHHEAVEDLRAYGAHVVDARVVDDNDLITSGGVTSGLDLGLWLVERFAGSNMAQKVSDAMEYRREGHVWRNSQPLPSVAQA
jgi:transcriptional regulator GlxA family with amidase domain